MAWIETAGGMGLWSAAQVRQAVIKGVITEAQYKEITEETI